MRKGACQCGAVQYESDGEPVALYVCHCLACRAQSASAFGMSLVVPHAGFRVVRGSPSCWRRRTDRGNSLLCFFCPHCGTRLWHQQDEAETVSIKAGSLDEPVNAGEAIHIWTRRKLPGIVIPAGARQFPGEPE